MVDDRGQAYTLEGLVAAVLIASSVILGLQAVDVAPWTSGPSQDNVDALRTQGEDLLAASADNGTLVRAVSCLDGDVPETDAYLPDRDASATALGPMLNETLDQRGYDYNVYLYYWDEDPSTGAGPYRSLNTTNPVVYPDTGQQRPQNGVVTVSRRVVLYDSMPAYNATQPGANGTCAKTGRTLAETNASRDIYVEDVYSDSEVYNVVEVRVEIW